LKILSDFNLRDEIKDSVKTNIMNTFKDKMKSEEINVNFSFISENELKNYIDLI
jgi:hypothetical protein